MPTADQNKLIFIEKTGHTYQMKNQEVADDILAQLKDWQHSEELPKFKIGIWEDADECRSLL